MPSSFVDRASSWVNNRDKCTQNQQRQGLTLLSEKDYLQSQKKFLIILYFIFSDDKIAKK